MKTLSEFPKNTKTPNMIKWETELSLTFSWEQWHNSMIINGRASSCVEHWDNVQKILNRWYLTPYTVNLPKYIPPHHLLAGVENKLGPFTTYYGAVKI